MQFTYESEHLLLALCDEGNAKEVTRFVTDNRDFFSPWEQLRPPAFFTVDYQREVLRMEFKAAIKGYYFRYYFHLKSAPSRIIGTVSFSDLSRVGDKSCKLGYKLAKEATGHGYAEEALLCLLPALHESLEIHRVEADIMENNVASRKLAERVGFVYEGVAHSSHKVNDVWQDHLRYAYIFEE